MRRLALAAVLTLGASTALAAPNCADAASADRGVTFAPLDTTLADLSLSVADKQLVLQDLSLLAGPCADAVYSTRMGKLSFQEDAPLDHPQIAGAKFVMAVNADRALNVGIWQTADGYLLAAYLQREGGFSAPHALLRSRHPLKSVTYFPSPDSAAGKLALLVAAGGRNVVVSLSWDHTALSRGNAHL